MLSNSRSRASISSRVTCGNELRHATCASACCQNLAASNASSASRIVASSVDPLNERSRSRVSFETFTVVTGILRVYLGPWSASSARRSVHAPRREERPRNRASADTSGIDDSRVIRCPTSRVDISHRARTVGSGAAHEIEAAKGCQGRLEAQPMRRVAGARPAHGGGVRHLHYPVVVQREVTIDQLVERRRQYGN